MRGRWRADTVPALLRRISGQALSRPGLLNRAAGALRHCLLVTLFEGERARTRREDEHARLLCAQREATDLGEEPGLHWFQERYSVSYKMSKLVDSGALADTMEVAATWDKVMDVYERVRAAVSSLAFVLCHFSHAYPEGCSLYFSFAVSDVSEEAQERRYDALWRAALSAARSAGAGVSHHHGVGLLKSAALREELGEGVRLLDRLKRELDPDGIMNPSKLWAAS
jgi:alkyldihydroxyacetonephosphate synthase